MPIRIAIGRLTVRAQEPRTIPMETAPVESGHGDSVMRRAVGLLLQKAKRVIGPRAVPPVGRQTREAGMVLQKTILDGGDQCSPLSDFDA